MRSKTQQKRIDEMIGKTFNYLTVVAFVNKDKWGSNVFEVVCVCGARKNISSVELRRGFTKSCGCQKSKLVGAAAKQRGINKHGVNFKLLRNHWNGMKIRCYSKNFKSYKYYGAKGIKICDEWRNNLKSFHDWAFANGFKPGLQLDRIDSTKDYSPDNCQWITPKENSVKACLKRWRGVDGLDLRGEHGKIT